MTGDRADRAYAWLMGQRAKDPKYAQAIQQEHHVPATTPPASLEAQVAVANLLREMRA